MAEKEKSNEIMCFACHQPPYCTAGYTMSGFPEGVTIDYPNSSGANKELTFLDNEKVSITSVLIPNGVCVLANCPETIILEKNGKEGDTELARLTPAKLSKTYKLSYDGEKFLRELDPWEWLQLALERSPKKILPKEFISTTTDCSGTVQTTTLKMYPKYKLDGKITLGSKVNAEANERIKKRHKYSREDALKLQKKTNKKKWKDIGKEIYPEDFNVVFESTVSIGDKTKKSDCTLVQSDSSLKHKKSLTHKTSELFKKIGNHVLGGNKNEGGLIKKLTIIPPQLELSGFKELKCQNDAPYFEYNYALKMAPLIGAEIVIDVIGVLITLLGSPAGGKAWKELRDQLQEMKERVERGARKNDMYGLFYIDVVLTGEVINGEGTLVSKNNEEEFKGEMGSKLSLQIRAGVEAGVKILCVKGQLMAEANTKTAVKSSLVFDEKGVGVVFNHEGIRSHFSIRVKAGKYTTSKKPEEDLSEQLESETVSGDVGYEFLTADVVWAEKSDNPPHYIIDA